MEVIINFLKQMWQDHTAFSAIVLLIIISSVRSRAGVRCVNCKIKASRNMFKEKGCPGCGSDKFNSVFGFPGTLIFYGIIIFLVYTIINNI